METEPRLSPPSPLPERPPPRIVIERIQPELDGGLFPVKRVRGDMLEVTADLLRDGHERIAAALHVRQHGEPWARVPFRPRDNDRWGGRIRLTRIGRAAFAIEAWTDRFGSWREETEKKRAAGLRLGLELQEGYALVEAAAARSTGGLRTRLEGCLQRLRELAGEEAPRADLLLSRRVGLWMSLAPDKSDAVRSPERLVTVDRPAARFSAWYEMFPRSQGTDPNRSATLADCQARFPELRALGFDVVYFVPIHPIGEVNRKGANNRPQAGPSDPGCPYAIGSRAGGHTAIDPSLGSLDDFRRLVEDARRRGLEIALDFAVQCAPDHPWVREHPRWFRRRPDGSIRYAENPPKKYEDIVNVDFEQPDWRELWEALREAVLFWVNEGVRIFRVDNPHTKPAAFWRWLIEEVQGGHPDVLFLAEAFTRPKMMRLLAKEGFSQSYTYFTWRNTKAELTDYLTELTRGESVEYLRPNFFTNTPDILPFFLQGGGRAAFRIRLALAATLSPCYGIYNGFELCEARAVPGREEYQDSEKYQYKVWDWNRPGNIKDDIYRLNRLRRDSPALQLFDNLRFHEASHGSVLFYSKSSPDGSDRIAAAVSLDPRTPVDTDIVFPLAEWGLPPDARFVTTELFSDWRQEWAGARHRIRIDPAAQPALVWRLG
ncbi:MAG TPA: alpha-1,4-glucan--maltose-1-phosphate maltosyltransferase [Opitutaceae bacterium]|nr:alpha-1,4-glucan--maltose-1-phosphate maltosyltransferase [Opitutaceae bacterium]